MRSTSRGAMSSEVLLEHRHAGGVLALRDAAVLPRRHGFVRLARHPVERSEAWRAGRGLVAVLEAGAPSVDL
jgi:hypothetical protein